MHARHVSCNLSDPLRLKLCALTVPTQGTMSPSPLEQTEIAMNKRTNLFLNYKLHCGLYRIVEEDPEVELPEFPDFYDRWMSKRDWEQRVLAFRISLKEKVLYILWRADV